MYRCPISLKETGAVAEVGPVFAILAGEGKNGFIGARLNFRDVIATARETGAFMYVIPTNEVQLGNIWYGYVRLGQQRWVRIPCPRPQAVYNRIPTRALERRPSAIRARQICSQMGIPMFNPEYFNKARIYEMLKQWGVSGFLPDTEPELNEDKLVSMLKKHSSVYLKPAGGSVGHGMIRIDSVKGGWGVSVLKHGSTQKYVCSTASTVWYTVRRERVPGSYVIQQAIPMIEYRGHPCDFRVLLQKQSDVWQVVGRGFASAAQAGLRRTSPMADPSRMRTRCSKRVLGSTRRASMTSWCKRLCRPPKPSTLGTKANSVRCPWISASTHRGIPGFSKRIRNR
nr:YheC/YheD family protein [Alicyclobacillus fastidiosus]